MGIKSCLFGALVVVGACKGNDAPASQQQQQQQSDPWAAKPPTSSGGAKKWYDADAPVGVWMGMEERMSPSSPLATYLRVTTMVAWPDGHLAEDAPATGLADFDFATWARDRGTIATYKRDGDHWTFSYGDSAGYEMKLVDGELRYKKARLRRAADVTGATLAGVYTPLGNPEDPSLAGPGCQQLVTFKPDGTFENRGGFARTCPADDRDPGKPGNGTYEIRDYSLILTYSDGRTDKRLITAPQNADLRKDNSRALIHGTVWSRRTGPTDASPVPTPTTATPPTPPVAAGDATTTTYDGVTFATPPGEVTRNKTSVSFTERTSDGFCMTIVFAGVPSTGKLDRDFAADWKDVVLNGRTAESEPTFQPATTPSGIPFGAGGAMTKETDGTRVYRVLLVFRIGSRRVSTMLVAPTEAQLAACNAETLITSIRGG